MKDLPFLNAENRVQDALLTRVLHARLEKTLKFFERYQIVDLMIFRHSRPIVYSKPGVVIIISTEVLKIAGDDYALVGVVAHELAHEHVALEFFKALQSRDLARLRELELFCDAIAVVVMIQLGLDPARYGRMLKMIANHSLESAKLNNGERSHPAVDVRIRIISDISALFLKDPGPGTTDFTSLRSAFVKQQFHSL